jgi:septation ring formation regulator EzrA
MKHQRHIDASSAALREARQTRTLIADINRIVQILNSDITAEEQQAGVFDTSQAEYPLLVRTLATRRDNLKETIAALEKRLAGLQIRTELELA